MTGMHPVGASRDFSADTIHSRLAQVAVVIPAWQPDHRLQDLVVALRERGLKRFVIVDDGSTPGQQHVLEDLSRCEDVVLLRHQKNLGKGRALKTAFAHLLEAFPKLVGAVTADADGQHLPEDVFRVAQRLAAAPDRPLLGVRRFAGDVPFRSRFGNALTCKAFLLLTGFTVSDTQTGLRGLPLALMPQLQQLAGERYEYETVMLAHLCRTQGVPEEVPIETVYLEGNRASHFHPIADSFRIYRALLHVSKPWQRKATHNTRTTDKPRLRHA